MPINQGQITDETKHAKKVPMHPKRNKQITNAKDHAKHRSGKKMKRK
jgi:hypothetical protein